ncbi:MAG: hypothetical protein RJB61_985, partial [Actinomycetota bacterium]
MIRGYWTVWTTVALDLVGFGIVVPILGLYAERFGASGFEVGAMFATFSVAQLLFSPLLGRLSDRIGRKPVIIISLVGTAVGSLVTGLANSMWLLFVGRAIDGASGASLAVAQAAVADMAPPDRRPQLVGMLGAAFGVGFVIGPAIGGLAALGGPHVPFFVAAALAGANAVAAAIRLPETRQREGLAPDAGVRHRRPRRAATPRLAQLAVVGVLTTLAFVGFESTFSLFGRARFDLTEGSAAFVFLGIGIVLVVVQGVAFGRVVSALGVHRVYPASLALVAVGLALVGTAASWPVLVAALLVLAVGQGIAAPSVTELVNRASPSSRRGEAM